MYLSHASPPPSLYSSLLNHKQKNDSEEEKKNENSKDTKKVKNAPTSTTPTTTAPSAPRKRGQLPFPVIKQYLKRKRRVKGESRIEEDNEGSDIGSADVGDAAQDSRIKIHITSQRYVGFLFIYLIYLLS